MKKKYITPQTLVMCVETIAPIAASGDFTVTKDDSGSDYEGVFYSPSNSLWGDDREFYNKPNSLWVDDEE